MQIPFNDRLGQKGYTIVARAPKLGLSELADGAWYVMGGSSPTDPDRMHDIDPDLIPFILSKGGDIVMYRLPEDGIGDAVPVLSRAGMEGRPPHLNHVLPYDAPLVARLGELRDKLTKVVPSVITQDRRTDRRLAACVASVLVVLFGAGAYYGNVRWKEMAADQARWHPDMNSTRDAAIVKGATMVVMPNAKNPELMNMYRVYPKVDGKDVRELVATFQRGDLDRLKGEIPDARIDWRKDW